MIEAGDTLLLLFYKIRMFYFVFFEYNKCSNKIFVVFFNELVYNIRQVFIPALFGVKYDILKKIKLLQKKAKE